MCFSFCKGSIFDVDELEQELVFQISVDWINEDFTILPRSNLVVHQATHQPDNSFEVSEKGIEIF